MKEYGVNKVDNIVIMFVFGLVRDWVRMLRSVVIRIVVMLLS